MLVILSALNGFYEALNRELTRSFNSFISAIPEFYLFIFLIKADTQFNNKKNLYTFMTKFIPHSTREFYM